MNLRDSEFHVRARAVMAALRVDDLRLPTHLIFRLSALVAGEPVNYGSVRFVLQGREPLASGEAVLFTGSRVIYAEFTASPTHGEPERGKSTITCGTWSRSSLARLSFEGTEGNND